MLAGDRNPPQGPEITDRFGKLAINERASDGEGVGGGSVEAVG